MKSKQTRLKPLNGDRKHLCPGRERRAASSSPSGAALCGPPGALWSSCVFVLAFASSVVFTAAASPITTFSRHNPSPTFPAELQVSPALPLAPSYPPHAPRPRGVSGPGRHRLRAAWRADRLRLTSVARPLAGFNIHQP